MELRHSYADVNGVRLHYVRAGQGELILFVHGFPEFWYEWKNQLPEFASDHHAVAVDMRGYNLSSKPADASQYRMEYLIEDLRALAEHLGYRRFTLVAHDWGRFGGPVLRTRASRSSRAAPYSTANPERTPNPESKL